MFVGEKIYKVSQKGLIQKISFVEGRKVIPSRVTYSM